MRTTLLVLLLLSSASYATESVWKWVDAGGVVHYSDRPIPGAVKVELKSTNQWNTASSAPTSTETNTASSARPDARPAYNTFEISTPVPEQAIVNTGGQVSISLRLEPALRPGHTITVYVDGQLVPGSPGRALQYAVQDVPRGEHNLSAVINDQSNQPVISASSIRFYLRQAVVAASPPVGPSLRPPR